MSANHARESSPPRPLRVQLEGELDVSTRDQLQGLLEQVRHESLLLDLSRVRFFDSAAAAVMHRAAGRMRQVGGRLTLTGVTPPIRKVLRILEMEDLLEEPAP